MTNESITNEWAEFLAYTKAPTYAVKNKKDNGFLGRFTMDMLMENYGFARILTILARGYLFHNPDGTPKGGEPYDRTDDARRFLCVWCSIPDRKNATPKAEWQFRTDFRELHGAFPELVDESGCGWYIRHLHGISNFIDTNRDKVGKTTHKIADSDWCVLPVTNVEAYLGSSALSRMYLGKLIGTVIERQKCGYNVPYLNISCH